MGVCGSFLAVELMRQGKSPQDAAMQVILRVADSYDLGPQDQVGIITLAPNGEWSSAALRGGFRAAVREPARDEMAEPAFVLLH